MVRKKQSWTLGSRGMDSLYDFRKFFPWAPILQCSKQDGHGLLLPLWLVGLTDDLFLGIPFLINYVNVMQTALVTDGNRKYQITALIARAFGS